MSRVFCFAVLIVLRGGSVLATPPCGCDGANYSIEAHRVSLERKCADLLPYTPSWSNGTWLTVSFSNETSAGQSWAPARSIPRPGEDLPLGGDLMWQPTEQDPRLQPFDADRFCEMVPSNGKILFVGDSTSHEMSQSLVFLLRRNSRCVKAVKFVRNDILDLGQNWHNDRCYLNDIDTLWLAKREHGQSFACSPWASPDTLEKAAVVVVNSGIHLRPCDRYVQQLASAAKFVKQHVRPEARLFFRNTVPGYNGCFENMEAHPQPHPTLEAAESYVWANPFRDSKEVVGMNWVAEYIFRHAGWGIIDAYSPSIMRTERNGVNKSRGMDCLHFGNKGENVLHHWNLLLYNALLH